MNEAIKKELGDELTRIVDDARRTAYGDALAGKSAYRIGNFDFVEELKTACRKAIIQAIEEEVEEAIRKAIGKA